MTQIFTAKTVEEARALAARTFGVAESEITFEVIEEPKRVLFGIKKGEAKVRATYNSIDVSDVDHRATKHEVEVPPVVEYDTVEDEKPAEEKSLLDKVVASAEAIVDDAVKEVTPIVKDAVEEVSPIVDDAMKEVAAVAEDAAKAIAPAAAEEAAEEPAVKDNKVPFDEELITGEPSENALAKIEKAKAYLAGILEQMGVEAEFVVTAGAESAMIDIVAANNGAVIGKRGETLDALQYLTFMIANRGDKEYYRIILNSANYRERRRKTLEELAAKIARNVLRSGRQTTLEPMNPYERRIIHSAIADIEGVSSRSVGEEPYRKVIISSTEKPVRRGRSGRDRDDRGGRRDRNDRGRRNDRRRRNPDAPPERISMDSMKTSFEKDYKRPKAEDEINAGLYGKIEF